MNRYAATGLLVDLLDGRRVVVITAPGKVHVRAALDVLIRLTPPGVKVRRTNGDEGLEQTQGTGRIYIAPQGASLRGWAADTVYADTDLTDEQLAIARLVAPEVIR